MTPKESIGLRTIRIFGKILTVVQCSYAELGNGIIGKLVSTLEILFLFFRKNFVKVLIPVKRGLN